MVSVTNACLALHISFVPFMSVSIVLFAAEPELTKLAIYLKANQCYAVLVVFLFVTYPCDPRCYNAISFGSPYSSPRFPTIHSPTQCHTPIVNPNFSCKTDSKHKHATSSPLPPAIVYNIVKALMHPLLHFHASNHISLASHGTLVLISVSSAGCQSSLSACARSLVGPRSQLLPPPPLELDDSESKLSPPGASNPLSSTSGVFGSESGAATTNSSLPFAFFCGGNGGAETFLFLRAGRSGGGSLFRFGTAIGAVDFFGGGGGMVAGGRCRAGRVGVGVLVLSLGAVLFLRVAYHFFTAAVAVPMAAMDSRGPFGTVEVVEVVDDREPGPRRLG